MKNIRNTVLICFIAGLVLSTSAIADSKGKGRSGSGFGQSQSNQSNGSRGSARVINDPSFAIPRTQLPPAGGGSSAQPGSPGIVGGRIKFPVPQIGGSSSGGNAIISNGLGGSQGGRIKLPPGGFPQVQIPSPISGGAGNAGTPIQVPPGFGSNLQDILKPKPGDPTVIKPKPGILDNILDNLNGGNGGGGNGGGGNGGGGNGGGGNGGGGNGGGGNGGGGNGGGGNGGGGNGGGGNGGGGNGGGGCNHPDVHIWIEGFFNQGFCPVPCPVPGFCVPIVTVPAPISAGPEVIPVPIEVPVAPVVPMVENGVELTLLISAATDVQGKVALVVNDQPVMVEVTAWQPGVVTVQMPTLLLTSEVPAAIFVADADSKVIFSTEIRIIVPAPVQTP